jgi:hypothetical protein
MDYTLEIIPEKSKDEMRNFTIDGKVYSWQPKDSQIPDITAERMLLEGVSRLMYYLNKNPVPSKVRVTDNGQGNHLVAIIK